MRQRAVQTQIEKVPEGHIDAGLCHYLPVRITVVKLQELQFQKEYGFLGRSAESCTVCAKQLIATTLEANQRFDLAQVMVVGDRGCKDFQITFIRWYIVGW